MRCDRPAEIGSLDAEIALRLVLSVKTINRHASPVAKLGTPTRRAAAQQALLGLT